jgi:hypothetical protein
MGASLPDKKPLATEKIRLWEKTKDSNVIQHFQTFAFCAFQGEKPASL